MEVEVTAAELARAQGVERVHLALLILRDGASKRLREAAAHVVHRRLLRLLSGERDADARRDDAQEAFLRVLRYVGHARLEDPRGSTAWLTRVAQNKRTDRLRKKLRAQAAAQRLRGEAEVAATTEGAPPGAELRPDALEDYRAELFHRVERALEGRQSRAQVTGRRQAELAWRRHVLGHARRELAQAPYAPRNPDTLSKWVNRGREQHLVPALRSWLEELSDDAPQRAPVEAMLGFFEGARRADAGRARPERRKSVSPGDHLTSVQVEATDDLPQDASKMKDDGDD